MKTNCQNALGCPPGYRMPEGERRQLEESRISEISLAARARYADIMYDTPFKLVFGARANKPLLIELLETLIPGKKISDLTFVEKEIPGFFAGDKRSVFDLFCKTVEGETFIVEMQLHEQNYFTDRVLFYSTYPIREQMVTPLEEERIRKLRDAGDAQWRGVVTKKNYRLSPVYMVSILNFVLPHARKEDLREGLVSSYSICSDAGSGELMTDALHFVFLELPRLEVERERPEGCKTMLEKIAFAFRHISFLQERPESFGGEFFEHLFHAAELAGMTLDDRNQYDREMTTELDIRAQIECAMEKGIVLGREEGLVVGRSEGVREGVVRTALNLRAEGVSEDVICRVTGLSSEEVKGL